MKMHNMRIGHGYDVHRFGDGSSVTLGGVHIPHSAGLLAHSDGDVLLHAICDALLGAIAAGDIGRHFPDDDPENAGIDSRLLLRRVMDLVVAKGFEVVNIDATIVAESPKMAAHVAAMCSNIAGDVGGAVDQVNIKATTTEGLGFSGRKEGIAAHAVVLLTSIGKNASVEG